MIELSIENRKGKNKVPSFNSDLKRFMEIIQDEQFVIEVTKKILDFYEKNLNSLENQNIFGFAYWNRFTGEIVVKIETDLYKIRTNLPFDNDLLSYFTVVYFNEFDMKNWMRTKHDMNSSDFLSLVSKSLKDKIDSQFKIWYKDLFCAISNNSLRPLEYYYSEFRVTPIDFLSEGKQLENYWLQLELFSSDNDDINYATLTLGDEYMVVSKFIFDNDLNLKEPFSYYQEQLVDYVLKNLENPDTLLLHELNLPLNFLKKVLDSGTNREGEILKVIESFKIKILDDFKLNHEEQLSENLFDFTGNSYYIDNPLTLEDFESFGIKDVKEKTMTLFIEYLKENGKFPSIYKSVLPEEVYKEAKKQNLIVEVFPSMSTMPLEEDPIVYSPIRSDINLITSEAYPVDFNLKSLEEYLSKTGSKTTKEVKKTIKLILQINNCRLSDELKSHLNFVLEMDTID